MTRPGVAAASVGAIALVALLAPWSPSSAPAAPARTWNVCEHTAERGPACGTSPTPPDASRGQWPAADAGIVVAADGSGRIPGGPSWPAGTFDPRGS